MYCNTSTVSKRISLINGVKVRPFPFSFIWPPYGQSSFKNVRGHLKQCVQKFHRTFVLKPADKVVTIVLSFEVCSFLKCCSHCLLGFCLCSLVCYAEHNGFLSILANISLGKRELIALLKLSSSCHMAVRILCLFLAATWVGLQCVIVAVSNHTHLLFGWANIDSTRDFSISLITVCSFDFRIVVSL